MLVTGIKSKPVYAPLQADTAGRYHLMLGHGVGGTPLLGVLDTLGRSGSFSAGRACVLYVADTAAAGDFGARFRACASDVRLFDRVAGLLADFRTILGSSSMGTRLYVAGPESFIGLAMKVALEFNLNKDEIRAEACGTLARRVYCIHCRATTENVRSNIVKCIECGRHLIVRDHYSRRFAAYMGVMADAEVPGRAAADHGDIRLKHAETIAVEVAAVEQVTPLIKHFTLAPVAGGTMPAFSGGSHIVVVMHRTNRVHRNPYSLMSPPSRLEAYEISVRRMEESRGGSHFMHDEVRVGSRLEIAHPVNLFGLDKIARKHLLIAGGIGITPFMAQLQDLHAANVAYEMHYSVREPQHAAFRDRLIEQEGDRLRMYYDSANELIDFEALLSAQPLGTHVYVCGPAGMIERVIGTARACGWSDSHIHWEQFSAPPVGDAFDAFLARSNLRIHVLPDQSLLESIEAAGVDAPYLCRGGVCGFCHTKVVELEGELIHNDHFLSNEEKASGKYIMPCVSRARCKNLVLDL